MNEEESKLDNKDSYEEIEENVRQTAAPREQQILSQSNLEEEIPDDQVKSGSLAQQVSDQQLPNEGSQQQIAPAAPSDHEEQIDLEEDTGMVEHQIDQEDGEEMHEQIIPQSQPPQVPEDGTYIDALNEAGVDQDRID